MGGISMPQTWKGQDQAKAQLDSITAMVERLEHAKECDGCPARGSFEVTYPASQLISPSPASADYHDEDAARQAIQESPLSVLVRSGWHLVGERASEDYPAEYEILLCTGGSAVRIRGDLDLYGQPDTSRLEYQDWGMPWTEYILSYSNLLDKYAPLLTYAQAFYYGE